MYKRQVYDCDIWRVTNIIWFCVNLQLLLFAIVKIYPWFKKKVEGKLPLSLNRSSPKTIGREYSTNQSCMQKRIWLCLNLRLLSFAIGKKSTDTHTDTFRKTTFFHVLSVVQSESAIISNTIFFAITILPFP